MTAEPTGPTATPTDGRSPAPRTGADDGSAVVEFLGVSLLLLVPLVYLVLVLAQLQAAAFAVDGAAREAARAVVTAPDAGAGAAAAVAATRLALDDQGLDPDAAEDALTMACTGPCDRPGSTLTVTVEVAVGLPLVPVWLRDVVPLAVPVRSTATTTSEPFVGRG